MKINDPLGLGFISIFLRFGDQGAKLRWRDRVSCTQIIFRKSKAKRVSFAVEKSLNRQFSSVTDK